VFYNYGVIMMESMSKALLFPFCIVFIVLSGCSTLGSQSSKEPTDDSFEEVTGTIISSRSVMLKPNSFQLTSIVEVALTGDEAKISFLFPINTQVKVGQQILISKTKHPSENTSRYRLIKYLE
jgi:hypothetical protein